MSPKTTIFSHFDLKVHVAKAGTKTIDIVTGSGHLYKRARMMGKIVSTNMLDMFSRTNLQRL